MAHWHCTSCTAAYSVGAPQCPQCGGTEHSDEPVERDEVAADQAAEDVEPKPQRKRG